MTSFHVEFHTEAPNDVTEGYFWYESVQEGLGGDFRNEVNSMIARIILNPLAYSEKHKKNYREAALERFPFVIVYRVMLGKQTIFIISIHHQSKRPNKKYRK